MRKLFFDTATYLAFVFVGVFIVLVLGGCQTEPPPPEPVSNEFVQFLHDADPEFRSVPDNDLVGLAHDICRMLNAGGGLEDFWSIALNSGLTVNQAGTLSGAATAFYCPWH